MLRRSRPDEIGIRDAEKLPKLDENLLVSVDEFRRRDSLLFRGALDVHAVFVSPCEVGDIVATHAFVARNHIADDCGVGRAQ